MTPAARVLIVANRTAATSALLEAVADRARLGPTEFHLVVPASPRGLHRVVDPEVAGREAARKTLGEALPALSHAAGKTVSGSVGDSSPLSSAADAVNREHFDEIMISTLRPSVSRWMRIDLLSKMRALGLPVSHVHPGSINACVVEAPKAVAASR